MAHNYFVDPDWLEAHLEDPQVRVLDATIFFDLNSEEMLKMGKEQYENFHIPGALEANLFEFSDPNAKFPFTVAESSQVLPMLEEMGISDDTHVVVYDSGPQVGVEFSASIWAARLAWQLLYYGLTKVSILEGGLDRWKAEGKPLSKEIKSYPRGKLNVTTQDKFLASKADVLAAIDSEEISIIDALSPEQYIGQINPYGDKRMGHIPSSFNIFYGDFADPATGKLYGSNDLAMKFIDANALSPDQEVILYCGFGVGAAWDFMILKSLGQDNLALYDGSLDEWTQDPSCPLSLD